MPVNKNEIRKDVLAKAMQCKTADELMELAKAEGFAITKDEAELSDIELDAKTLKNVAGGGGMCWENFKFKLD